MELDKRGAELLFQVLTEREGGFKRSWRHRAFQQTGEYFHRCLPPERLAGTTVKLSSASLSRSAWECNDRSVPFGKCCRSNPLVFSFGATLPRRMRITEIHVDSG